MPKTQPVELIVPDISLFHKLGARSRAFPMVVTELVDNSLDSWIEMPKEYKKGIKLKIEISASEKTSSRFIVKDNAGGMTRNQLIDAMTVARSHKTGNSKLIGNFGFGLKSAAMYIGSQFHIFSLSYEEPGIVNYVSFDKEKFVAWELEFKQMSVKEAEKIHITFPDGHGTIIDVRNERYRSANKKGILRRLQRTFAPRIPKDPRLKTKFSEYKDDMDIILNLGDKRESVIAAGPFYTFWNNSIRDAEKSAAERLRALEAGRSQALLKEAKKTEYLRGDYKAVTEKNEEGDPSVIPEPLKWMTIQIPGIIDIPESEIKDPKGKAKSKKVWGRIGILDRGMAHNYEYGFDLIKNGRVVEEFVLDKNAKDNQIGLVASNHNARIVGQLFLDEWDTDHQKLSFLKDSEQWEALAKFVAEQIDKHKLLSISSNLQHPGELLKKRVGIVDENDSEVIADEKFEEQAPGIQKAFQKAVRSSAFKGAMKSVATTKRASTKSTSGKVADEPKGTRSSRGNEQKPKQTTTAMMAVTPMIEQSRDGEDAPLVSHKLKSGKNGSIFQIFLNRDHPFLARREGSELKVLGELLALDTYASFVLSNKEELTHEDFIAFRDTLLRESRQKKK